ncbi:MAG: SRPBCC family protein [Nitrososphaerota archaeon]|nr:SRPBCC family protein [Nitrososphaerota archaeon]MDG6990633.1 SRPBCC family protein [Nitrososphaerota archaeon]
MQLHLEGSNAIKASADRVYSMLTDPGFVAKTLPDAEDVRVLDGSSLEAKIKLRIAVVSSTLRMRLTIGKTAPPTKATMTAEGSGSGSAMKITSVFELSGGPSTTMRWSADADITGVMAGIGSTLLKGFATKKVSEIFTSITAAVEAAA